MSLYINDRITIPDDEIVFVYSRAGGPGGQHVNKVETRAQLRFALFKSRVFDDGQKARLAHAAGRRLTADGELLMSCGKHRERSRNRDDLLERLRAFVLEALAPKKVRKKTKPTRGSQQRRLASKQRRSDIKRDRKRPRLDD